MTDANYFDTKLKSPKMSRVVYSADIVKSLTNHETPIIRLIFMTWYMNVN